MNENTRIVPVRLKTTEIKELEKFAESRSPDFLWRGKISLSAVIRHFIKLGQKVEGIEPKSVEDKIKLIFKLLSEGEEPEKIVAQLGDMDLVHKCYEQYEEWQKREIYRALSIISETLGSNVSGLIQGVNLVCKQCLWLDGEKKKLEAQNEGLKNQLKEKNRQIMGLIDENSKLKGIVEASDFRIFKFGYDLGVYANYKTWQQLSPTDRVMVKFFRTRGIDLLNPPSLKEMKRKVEKAAAEFIELERRFNITPEVWKDIRRRSEGIALEVDLKPS